MEPTTPVSNPAPMTPEPPKKSPMAGIIAIVLVLILIILGALYAWGERIAEYGDLSPEEAQLVNELEQQSNSTDPEAIQADLSAESSAEFDSELDAAFQEMDAAFETQ